MKRILSLLFGIFCLTVFTLTSNGLAASALQSKTKGHSARILRVGGGSAPMENIFKRIKEPFFAKTGITLELHESGPVEAWNGLFEDKVDVAASGTSSFVQWSALVRKSGKIKMPISTISENKPVFKQIGDDTTTVYTHHELYGITKLTKDQIKNIFSGRLANWQEVGGPNLPITVVLGDKVEGLTSYFQRTIMLDAPFTDKAVHVDTAAQMKERVLKTPGAVSFGTLASVADKRVRNIEYPAVSRTISMLYLDNSPKKQMIQQLYDYIISEEGKKHTLYVGSNAKEQRKAKMLQRL